MLTTKKLMDFSWMSQASYLHFVGLDANAAASDLQALLEDSPINANNNFSSNQAVNFTNPYSGYTFVSHQSNDLTGFSATVFKSNSGSSCTIVVRGTEASIWNPLNSVTDLVWADIGGVVLTGKAIPQLIESFKYYKQITTPDGQAVEYSAVELKMMGRLYARNSLGIVGELLPEQITTGIAEFVTEVSGDIGLGELIPDGATVNFTGHSLGGHVAYLLAEMVAVSRGES